MKQRRRTTLEQAVYDALRSFPQYEVREQVRIGGKYRVDFLVGSLVIEVQGAWTHTSLADVQRDLRRVERLKSWGYEVVLLPEDEIMDLSPLALIDRLDDILRRHEHCASLPRRHL